MNTVTIGFYNQCMNSLRPTDISGLIRYTIEQLSEISAQNGELKLSTDDLEKRLRSAIAVLKVADEKIELVRMMLVKLPDDCEQE